jgi:hypothetical protein
MLYRPLLSILQLNFIVDCISKIDDPSKKNGRFFLGGRGSGKKTNTFVREK